jgi:hypothetical protein
MTATITEFDELVASMVALRIPRDKAEAAARAKLGISAIDAPVVDEAALENAIEAEGDKLMRAHGFQVVRLSQVRRSKVHPGLPDRRFYRLPRPDAAHTRLAYAVWWEAKSATGKQRPDQRAFQEMVEACGETYLLGTHEVLYMWLVEHRIARTP